MATCKRCGVIVAIVVTTGLFMSLFWQTAFVKASTVVDDPEPPLIGEPCGSGELLPDWVICLHGFVGVEQPGGQVQLQDGVTVKVAYGGEIVTGTTFVHPGKLIPTFGIDISPLEPAFLQPVTVTVVVDNVTIKRQVVVFPDFNTQNQQVDVVVPIGVLSPHISGSVIDFASGGPVAGAGVAVAHINQTVYVTTAVPISGEQPIFGVDPASLPGLQTGDTLTFTTTYNGDTDQQTMIYNDAEPIFVNLVTGWKCDGFDPLPRTGPGSGLPRTGPGSGLPDVACFWGYVRQDGQPLAGVDVHITVSDTVYSGQTGAFAGEGLARYGIGLWGAGDLDGGMVTITAVYNGKTTTETNPINLDAQLSQRTDLILAQPESLANFIS
ncbi:MAG: hypothetical protein KDE48_10315, partial [Anaerolineales bacterium]|nr:hypothetical protein [Anaerolineales bacterium]